MKSKVYFRIFLIVLLFNSVIISNVKSYNKDSAICFERLPVDDSNNICWNKTVGGAMEDRAYDVIETNDGGYAFAGEYIEYNESDPISMTWGIREMILVKADENGNISWSNTYNKEYGLSSAYTLIQCKDNGYALTGYVTINVHDEIFFVKTYENGTLEWNRIHGWRDEERIYSIIQTDDDGFLITGFTDSFHYIGDSVLIMKLDAEGNEEWHVTYGGTSTYEFEITYGMVEVEDGFILSGYTSTYGSYPGELGKEDVWLFKINKTGQMQWNKTYGYDGIDRAFSLIQTIEGDFVLAGFTSTNNLEMSEDIYVIKTDRNGILKWETIIKGKASDRAYSVIENEDKELILTGYTDSGCSVNNREGILVKLDKNGEVIWNYCIGGNRDDEFNSIILDSNNDYVLAGSTKSYGKGNYDLWMMKISGDFGEQSSQETTKETEERTSSTLASNQNTSFTSFTIIMLLLFGLVTQIRKNKRK